MSKKSLKHNPLLSICFLIVLFITNACKNEEAQPESYLESSRATSEKQLIESTFGVGVDSIEYNTDQQPKKFVTGGMRAEVKYENDKVVFSFYGQDLIKKKVYEIENGLVKTLTEYNYIGAPGIKTFASSFIYNGGKISKEIITFEGKPFGYTEYSYDNSQENLVLEKTFDHSGNHLTTTTFEYTQYLDKSSSHNEWNRWMDGALFPKRAKYLLKKSTTNDHFTGKKVSINYEYVLDDLGYVVSAQETMSNNSVYKWSNTWQ